MLKRIFRINPIINFNQISRPIVRIIINTYSKNKITIKSKSHYFSVCSQMCLPLQLMTSYTQIIKQILWQNYHDPNSQAIVISTLNLKFITPKAQLLLQQYSHLKSLSIIKCDLRKLQNFPFLPRLVNLDLSNNSLQGTFNYLMPLASLEYLNIAHNLVSDYRALEPLRRLRKLAVHLKDNPFTEQPNWKGKIRLIGLNILKDPKSLAKIEVKEEESSERQQQKKRPLAQQKKERQRRPFNFGRLMMNLPNNFQHQFFEVRPQMPFSQSGFLMESAQHVNNLLPDDNQQDDEGSELNIEVDNGEQQQLQLPGDEEQGQEDFLLGENEEEGDEEPSFF